MYIPLILFFISLAGITVIITRKVFVLKKEEIESSNDLELVFEVPDLDKIGKFANKKIKRYGYIVLVYLIRFYLISGRFFKKQGLLFIQKIKNTINKSRFTKRKEEVKKESSKFIKTISEYKNKIKKIKHKIKEEEKINRE